MKVYYSIEKKFSYGYDHVKKIWKRINKAWDGTKINAQPLSFTKVRLALTHRGKKIDRWTYAIVTKHIHAPEPAWTNYITGHPYDWNCLDRAEHPQHNPIIYLEFKRRAKEIARAYGMPATGKLGDIVYCTHEKRWVLVDCG
jgi:hypothetical protein